jgi:hypothetical protein
MTMKRTPRPPAPVLFIRLGDGAGLPTSWRPYLGPVRARQPDKSV